MEDPLSQQVHHLYSKCHSHTVVMLALLWEIKTAKVQWPS